MSDTEISRRIDIERMLPAELALRNAELEIEKLGADERLTNAVILLAEAQEKVSDFIDGEFQRLAKLAAS